MDLSLSLTDTHVLITGSNGHIGRVVVQAFLSAGARVSCLDLHPTPNLLPEQDYSPSHFHYYESDITNEGKLSQTFDLARQDFGLIQCCVALAGLDLSFLEHHESLADMTLQQWRETHRVNVEGTFLTARTWLRQLRDAAIPAHHDEQTKEKGEEQAKSNISLILVGSESGLFGERSHAAYSAGKSAVQTGLLLSLVNDLPRIWPGARVNAIAPGPVDTAQFRRECAADPAQYWLDAQATVAARRPVPTEDVAKGILFLASENWSGSVNGQVLRVDGGKMGKVMWLREEC